MERSSSATQPPAGQEPSAGELVRQLSEQVSVLVRDELKLARLEMTRKGKQAGLGAGMLGAGGLTALYGVACLLACVVIALSGAVAAWLAALIVGVVLLAASAAAALLGKGRLQKATPPAPRTGRRQRQGRCRGDQGKGAPMTTEGPAGRPPHGAGPRQRKMMPSRPARPQAAPQERPSPPLPRPRTSARRRSRAA